MVLESVDVVPVVSVETHLAQQQVRCCLLRRVFMLCFDWLAGSCRSTHRACSALLAHAGQHRTSAFCITYNAADRSPESLAGMFFLPQVWC